MRAVFAVWTRVYNRGRLLIDRPAEQAPMKFSMLLVWFGVAVIVYGAVAYLYFYRHFETQRFVDHLRGLQTPVTREDIRRESQIIRRVRPFRFETRTPLPSTQTCAAGVVVSHVRTAAGVEQFTEILEFGHPVRCVDGYRIDP